MTFSELFPADTTLHLSSDMNTWADQITSHAIEKYPTLSRLVGEIVFSKVEKVKRSALGYITLIGRKQRIPFIVDDCDLNPLDLYIDEGMYLPLNENSANRIASQAWPFKLVSQEERQSILKTASVIASVGVADNNFIERHKDELSKIAEQYPELLDLIKVAQEDISVEPFAVRCFVKTAASDKPLVVRDLKAGDREFSPSDFSKAYGKEFLSKVMEDGETIVSTLTPRLTLNYETFTPDSCVNKETGYAKINGVEYQGRNYKNIDLLGSSRQDSGVFISTRGEYLPYRQPLYNKNLHNNNDDVNIVTETPVQGDIACIIQGGTVFGPFKILSISRVNNETVYSVENLSLNKANLVAVFGLKQIKKLDNNTILIPATSALTKLNPIQTYVKDMFEKLAALNVVVSKLLNGKFSISDAGISGISAAQLKEMSKGDAIVALMHCGLSEQDAKYALTVALDKGSYSFPATTKVENKQVAEAPLKKQAEEILEAVEDSNLLKIAVITGDKSNIDAALGLNLISYQNVKRFKILVPDIVKMLDKLGKLLICKRMNRELIKINEPELAKAIQTLYNINLSLSAL